MRERDQIRADDVECTHASVDLHSGPAPGSRNRPPLHVERVYAPDDERCLNALVRLLASRNPTGDRDGDASPDLTLQDGSR
jgi:hypothetical protein